MKKQIKKILRNCPYITALFAIWFFLTAGGICLMAYRDYGKTDWKKFWENPFFAVIMEEEMHGSVESPGKAETAMAKTEKRNDGGGESELDKITRVIIGENRDAEQTISKNIAGGLLDVSNDVLAAESSLPEIRNDNTDMEGLPGMEQSPEPDVQMPGEVREEDMQQAGETREERYDKDKDAKQEAAGGTEKKQVVGRTVFTTYTPVETHSVYYTDAGEVALTTEYPYTAVEETYFDDAAFIGDSRTLGISDYSGLHADFYCENGMTIYKMLDEKGIIYQKNGEKVNLAQVLKQKEYGKIYIMLGMNELGYRDTNYFMEKYREVLDEIRTWQPQAVIYVMANLHVSEQKNNNETEFNNININAKNAAIANLADGINIFYLDSNPLFTDEKGFLKADLTFDGVHLYADNYPVWKAFLMEHGVIREDEGE